MMLAIYALANLASVSQFSIVKLTTHNTRMNIDTKKDGLNLANVSMDEPFWVAIGFKNKFDSDIMSLNFTTKVDGKRKQSDQKIDLVWCKDVKE